MRKLKLYFIPVLLVVLAFTGIACSRSSGLSQEDGRKIAEEFVRQEATFRFDGMEDTLGVTDAVSIEDGWKFTIEFDSRHAGYGARTGQMLAQVITHHTAEITVKDGSVTEAVMDGSWDMINQQMLDNFEIRLAPIHEVGVYFMKSNPVQVGVHIVLGLSDGCTTFHDAVVTREGNTIDIEVTTVRPKDKMCTAIYGYFEQNLNLGSDFEDDITYNLKVNDYTTTFSLIGQGPLDTYEIKPAPIHKVDVVFMESYPVQIGVQIQGGESDGCTTFHEAIVTREGNVVNIEVTVKRPKDRQCPAVYTFFEENLNLGSDFTGGETYTLKVNDYTTTFEYPR